MCILQGVRLLQVEAMPTCGFSKSASRIPTARSMARLGVCLTPSTTSFEYLRGSTAADGLRGVRRGCFAMKTNFFQLPVSMIFRSRIATMTTPASVVKPPITSRSVN